MSLNDVWEGAAASPYYPAVPKERQFLVAFSLLFIGNKGTLLCEKRFKLMMVSSFLSDQLVRSQ